MAEIELTSELIARLNRMADSLYHVAGAITRLSRCDSTAVVAGCECAACKALWRTHEVMNELERMVRENGRAAP